MKICKSYTYKDEDNSFLSKFKCLPKDKYILDFSINKCSQNRGEDRVYQKYIPQEKIQCISYENSYLVSGIKQKSSCIEYAIYDINGCPHDSSLGHDVNIHKSARKNIPLKELSCKINYNCEKYDKVCPIISASSDQWQHFMWESVCNLVWISDWLRFNSDVSLVVYTPKFDSFEYIIRDILKLKNKIIYINKNETIFAKEIFSVRNIPFDQHKFCPPHLIRKVREKFCNNEVDNPKNVIFIPRLKQKNRRVENFPEVFDFLNEYCTSNGLNLIVFDAGDMSHEERFKIFNEAKFVISPHGGSNYHCYWFNKNCKLIEIVFPSRESGFHELGSVCCSFGLDYTCMVSEYNNHYSNFIYLSIDKLKDIFDGKDTETVDTNEYYWNNKKEEIHI